MRQFSMHITSLIQPEKSKPNKGRWFYSSAICNTENTLTIGIPVKNEEKNIVGFIKYLQKSVGKIKFNFPELPIEVLFCFNGTTDNSKTLAENTLQEFGFIDARIIESAPGKMNAMCQIAKVRKQNGWIGFLDADTKVDENCLVHLIRALKNDKGLFLTYAQVEPVFASTKKFLHKIQTTHYKLRNYISPRKHFHGRAFIMRSDYFLRENLKQSNKYTEWALQKGPLVDDIYLSRAIAYEHGIKSICQNENAVVGFSPPSNLRDLYYGQRRVLFELKRLDLLYPEHSYLQSIYFKKSIRWGYFIKCGIAPFLSYTTYYFIEEIMRLVIRIEMLLISLKILRCRSIWKTLRTTKMVSF